MRIRAALLLLAAAAFRCQREAAPPKPQAQPAAPAAVNLLQLSNGASVVSRTAEYWYETTAAHAMDGDDLSHWASPPAGAEQTLVVAFPARSRIRRLGISTTRGTAVPAMRVESSLDGAAWAPVTTLSFDPSSQIPQVRDVAPFEALYLQLQTIAPNQMFTVIRELHAFGDELEAPHPGSIAGCWTINGRAARFEQKGAQVRGVIDPTDREKTIQLDGGFDGRAHRFMWLAGAQWGDAILTVSPDGNSISGVSRHKNLREDVPGDGWLGTRGPCSTAPFQPDAIRARVLPEIHRYPLFALRFDAQDRLLADQSAPALDDLARLTNVRLVVRSSAAQLAALRDALAARGLAKYEVVDGTADAATIKPRFSAAVEIER